MQGPVATNRSPERRPPTLVTGASGFIGRALCGSLAVDGQVRSVVREPRAGIPGENVTVPDLALANHLGAVLDGVGQVVHLAARVHVMRDSAADPLTEYRRINVTATHRLVESAGRAGVQRFVFVSSVKAVGEATEAAWTEETPPRPVDPYGISKLEAEAVVREVTAQYGMAHVILRLPLVYGPGVGANALQLLRWVDRGLPLPLGHVRNARSMVARENVVGALRTVLDSAGALNETFFVSDGRPLSTPELLRIIAGALGRPARLLPVPLAFLRAMGRLGDRVGSPAGFPVTSAVLERLLGSLVVDSSKLSRLTGFVPPVTPEQGWSAVAAWYRAGMPAGA